MTTSFDRNYYAVLPFEDLLRHCERVPASEKTELMHGLIAVVRDNILEEGVLYQKILQLEYENSGHLETIDILRNDLRTLKEKFDKLKANREDPTAIENEIQSIFETFETTLATRGLD